MEEADLHNYKKEEKRGVFRATDLTCSMHGSLLKQWLVLDKTHVHCPRITPPSPVVGCLSRTSHASSPATFAGLDSHACKGAGREAGHTIAYKKRCSLTESRTSIFASDSQLPGLESCSSQSWDM